MKAEERKQIETNSVVLGIQRLRERVTGRTLYFAVGLLAVAIGAILLYRYYSKSRTQVRDAGLLQLASADTAEKLKQGMEEHRGTLLGSQFKLHLARYELRTEGLPKLATDRPEDRKKAAASVEAARTHFQELTGEFKGEDQQALLQEAWLGLAQAEEALVGMPTADGGTDSRGDPDKAIEYYEKAAAVFPDSEFSKRYKAWADTLRTNKDQFVAVQKELYRPRESVALPPPGKSDLFGPGLPKGDLFPPPGGLFPPKTDLPVIPAPSPAEPPKAEPKAK